MCAFTRCEMKSLFAYQRLKSIGAVMCALDITVGHVPALIPASPVSGASVSSSFSACLEWRVVGEDRQSR